MGEIDAGGRGDKSKSKVLEQSGRGPSSIQWRWQQAGRQSPRAQRHEDGRFPAEKIESSTSCSIGEIRGEVHTEYGGEAVIWEEVSFQRWGEWIVPELPCSPPDP